MSRVFNGERTFLSPVLRPVEAVLYRLGGLDERHEQHWLAYTIAMLLFHVGGFLILYALLRLQGFLPFNPAEQSAVAPDLAFNTAVSFITNTNWQNYGGESTLSYLVQMLGLTPPEISFRPRPASCSRSRLIRGFARASAKTVGNFWVDITRCTLYILLPICIRLRAVPGLGGYPADARSLRRRHDARRRQADHRGRARCHPRSPSDARHQWRRLLQCQCAHTVREPDRAVELRPDDSIIALGAALTNVFGRMSATKVRLGDPRRDGAPVHRRRRGLLLGRSARQRRVSRRSASPAATWRARKSASARRLRAVRRDHHGCLHAVPSTPCNDSFTALGGMIPLINIQLGEVVIGGVGAGLYGMLLFVILSIFVAGLMVGRHAGICRKKIEAKESRWRCSAILVLPLMYRSRRSPSSIRRRSLDRPMPAARFTEAAVCLRVADRQ